MSAHDKELMKFNSSKVLKNFLIIRKITETQKCVVKQALDFPQLGVWETNIHEEWPR